MTIPARTIGGEVAYGALELETPLPSARSCDWVTALGVLCVAIVVVVGLPSVNGSTHPPPGLRLPSTTTTTTAWMKVLEGPRPAAESLAVPAWLADDPELRRRGITLVECLRPVSSL